MALATLRKTDSLADGITCGPVSPRHLPVDDSDGKCVRGISGAEAAALEQGNAQCS
jgi:hypothetical protein